MQPRPTPTSPRYAHRFQSTPVAPLVAVTSFASALVTLVLATVLFRLLPPTTQTSTTPGAADAVHPLERLRELRAAAVTQVLSKDGTVRAPAVGIGSAGWVATIASASAGSTQLRTASGTSANVVQTLVDSGSTVVFLKTDASMAVVPLATPNARFVGESVALLTPTAIAGDVTVAPATIVSTHALATESGSQSSDRSPSVLRIQALGSPSTGTPVFTLTGDLLGLVIGIDASGSIAVEPSWVWAGVVRDVVTSGTILRPLLGLNGHPADPRAGGDPGLVVAGTGSTPAVVKGSPADLAGILAGDTILRVGEDGVTLDHPLADLVAAHDPGDTVTLTIRRAGVERTISVTLATATST